MVELLGFTLAELEHFYLIVLRISAMFFTFPIFNSNAIPLQMKVLFSFFLAMIVFNLVPVPTHLPVLNIWLIYFSVIEISIGLAIGIAANFIFEGLLLSGFIMGRMMGLSMLSLVDPTTDDSTNALGQYFKFIIILLLFASNAHHYFIQILVDNFYLIPISEPVFDGRLLSKLMLMTSQIFVLGIKFSAPIAAILILEKVLLAIFAKVSPEMNVFIIGMPLGLLIGFYALTFYTPYLQYVFFKAFEIYKSEILEFIKILGMK